MLTHGEKELLRHYQSKKHLKKDQMFRHFRTVGKVFDSFGHPFTEAALREVADHCVDDEVVSLGDQHPLLENDSSDSSSD